MEISIYHKGKLIQKDADILYVFRRLMQYQDRGVISVSIVVPDGKFKGQLDFEGNEVA